MADGQIGRPTVMTPEVLTKLREAFLMGCTDVEACLYANIGTTALYKFLSENPEFAKERTEWKEHPVLKARKNIDKALNEENIPTSQWYLERKKKDEFSARTEQTGKEGGAIEHKIVGMRIINESEQSNGGDELPSVQQDV